MGCEVRRVAPDWQHPLDEYDNCIPLIDGLEYAAHVSSYERVSRAWESGDTTELVARYGVWIDIAFREHLDAGHSLDSWNGPRPDPNDYMPRWEPEQRSHVQLYESTTEGTPLSPVFATLAGLAAWACGYSDFEAYQQELEFLLANISGERPWD